MRQQLPRRRAAHLDWTREERSAPCTPGPRPSQAAHHPILQLQQLAGNKAVAGLLASAPRDAGMTVQRKPPLMSRADPVANYPFLKLALTQDQLAELAAPAGRLSVPVARLLPPTLSYRSRAQMLASLYPSLASMSGPAANVKALIAEITEGETLRQFVPGMARRPVSIVREIDDSLTFSVAGKEIQTRDGMITPTALDVVTVPTTAMIGLEARDAAIQLVDLRFLEVMANYASDKVMPLAVRVVADPAGFARAEVEQMSREMSQLAKIAERVNADLLPANWDLGPAVTGYLARITSTRAFVVAAHRAATAFADANQVDQTSGQIYDEAEDEYAAGAHWSPRGVLSGANWFATKVFHLVGETVTVGHLGRQAANAKAYQDGYISYRAWKKNEGWNFAKSVVAAAVTALTGGLASRAAAGFFSIEAGYTAAGSATLTGTVVGGVSSASGAVASDLMSKIAAELSDDPYVRDYQTSSVAGPLGWLSAGLSGAMLGGLFGRLFGGRRSSTADDLESLRETSARNAGETPPTAAIAGSAEPVAIVNGKPVKPTGYGTVLHGNDILPEEVQAAGGLPTKGSNWDLVNHSEEINLRTTGTNDSALRGATRQLVTPDGERGAVHWGAYVYEIRGMPTWDLEQVLQGRVPTPGGFRGVLMVGELETAIPARVPLANIVRYGKVVMVRGRLTVTEWKTFDAPGGT